MYTYVRLFSGCEHLTCSTQSGGGGIGEYIPPLRRGESHIMYNHPCAVKAEICIPLVLINIRNCPSWSCFFQLRWLHDKQWRLFHNKIKGTSSFFQIKIKKGISQLHAGLALQSRQNHQHVTCCSLWDRFRGPDRPNLELLQTFKFLHSNTSIILTCLQFPWCSRCPSIEAATCSEVIYPSELGEGSRHSWCMAPFNFSLPICCPVLRLLSTYVLPLLSHVVLQLKVQHAVKNIVQHAVKKICHPGELLWGSVCSCRVARVHFLLPTETLYWAYLHVHVWAKGTTAGGQKWSAFLLS